MLMLVQTNLEQRSSGTGTASGTAPAKAAGGTDEGTTDGRSKGGDTSRPDEPPRPLVQSSPLFVEHTMQYTLCQFLRRCVRLRCGRMSYQPFTLVILFTTLNAKNALVGMLVGLFST